MSRAARPVFEDDGAFGIGRVFARMGHVLGKDFVTLLALVALFAIPERIAAHAVGYDSPLLAPVDQIVLIFCGFGLQLAVMHLALRRFVGTPAGLGACVGKALTAFFPAALLYFLSGLATAAAMLVLIVPGVMVLTAWSVILPVYLAEDGGLFASFGRSSALTRGHRWKILAVMLLLGFGLGLLCAVLMPIWGMHGPLAALTFLNGNWLMRLLFNAAMGLTIAAIYRSLAGSPTDVADAFD